MTEEVGPRLRRALLQRGWSQNDLAAASGLNKNTITAVMRDEGSPQSIAKIEVALGMTPGTLAALGEDTPPPAAGRPASQLTDAELLEEFTYRFAALRRKASALERELEERAEEWEKLEVEALDDRLIRQLGFDPDKYTLQQALVEAREIDPSDASEDQHLEPAWEDGRITLLHPPKGELPLASRVAPQQISPEAVDQATAGEENQDGGNFEPA